MRRWTNFTVRYKWALRKEFKEITAPDPFYPDFEQFLKEEKDLLKSTQVVYPTYCHCISVAHVAKQEERRTKAVDLLGGLQQRLNRLTVLIDGNPWYHLCREDFKQHVRGSHFWKILSAYLTHYSHRFWEVYQHLYSGSEIIYLRLIHSFRSCRTLGI